MARREPYLISPRILCIICWASAHVSPPAPPPSPPSKQSTRHSNRQRGQRSERKPDRHRNKFTYTVARRGKCTKYTSIYPFPLPPDFRVLVGTSTPVPPLASRRRSNRPKQTRDKIVNYLLREQTEANKGQNSKVLAPRPKGGGGVGVAHVISVRAAGLDVPHVVAPVADHLRARAVRVFCVPSLCVTASTDRPPPRTPGQHAPAHLAPSPAACHAPCAAARRGVMPRGGDPTSQRRRTVAAPSRRETAGRGRWAAGGPVTAGPASSSPQSPVPPVKFGYHRLSPHLL